ncbi:30S ribosomal protein S20 [Candidatus Saccharibacteria bacterium]|jgi:ribosomal protein S20|nr:30S ribosomal protein S20 [Candidatus Saccharibacteria bacterium]
MPIIKSAKKAARQAVKRRNNNQATKKVIRNALKDFRNKPTAEKMAIVQSEYDKAVKKGLMKKNTASRRKANLAKWAKEHNVKIATATSKKVAAPKAETKVAEKPVAKTTTKKTATKKAPAKKATAKKTTAKKAAEK